MNEQDIKIKDIEIPIVVKSYKTSKSVKIFFKNNTITITKPKRLPYKHVAEIIKENEDFIYHTYLKGIQNSKETKKHWQTGEVLSYKGEGLEIQRKIEKSKKIYIELKEAEKQIHITVPEGLDEKDITCAIEKGIKKLLKNKTENYIQERLPYFSNMTGIIYNRFMVRDATTRYGSCVAKTKLLRFSSRLIMLPQDVIDAIIVHELCHIVYANHSKDFYALVKKYIPDYAKIDKWLKKNGKIIMI